MANIKRLTICTNNEYCDDISDIHNDYPKKTTGELICEYVYGMSSQIKNKKIDPNRVGVLYEILRSRDFLIKMDLLEDIEKYVQLCEACDNYYFCEDEECQQCKGLFIIAPCCDEKIFLPEYTNSVNLCQHCGTEIQL